MPKSVCVILSLEGKMTLYLVYSAEFLYCINCKSLKLVFIFSAFMFPILYFLQCYKLLYIKYITILFCLLSYVSRKSCSGILELQFQDLEMYFRVVAPHSQSNVFNNVVSQLLTILFVHFTRSLFVLAVGLLVVEVR